MFGVRAIAVGHEMAVYLPGGQIHEVEAPLGAVQPEIGDGHHVAVPQLCAQPIHLTARDRGQLPIARQLRRGLREQARSERQRGGDGDARFQNGATVHGWAPNTAIPAPP